MLDLNYVRGFFPGFQTNWILFDNAGGSQIAQPVIDKINDYYRNTNVQLGGSYQHSAIATKRVADAQDQLGTLIHADPGEVVLGSSTSLLIKNLSLSMADYLPKGSEIIVTNCDHEANIGAWRALADRGFVIKTWEINPETWTLELEDLRQLMTDKTRLVAFTHASNILGKINPVKEITQFVHEHGALVCVDAVAFAPHRAIDVKDWDVDFYVFSLYKTYGPHYALMYMKKAHLLALPGNNHYFIGADTAYKFQPGNVNYELTWGATGLNDYFKALARHHHTESIHQLISDHEEALSKEFLDFLNTKNRVRIIGPKEHDQAVRVPTLAFVLTGTDSESICLAVDQHKIGIRFGDFYAARLIDSLGLRQQNGVVRVSMVHYNTLDEVKQLIKVLDPILS